MVGALFGKVSLGKIVDDFKQLYPDKTINTKEVTNEFLLVDRTE